MKKLLGIIVLSLLFGGNAYAKETTLICELKKFYEKRDRTSQKVQIPLNELDLIVLEKEYLVLDFDKKMSNLTPYEFVDNVINNAIDVSHLIVGYNFKFGKDRSGDVEALTNICKKLKIDLSIIDKVGGDSYIFSSSSVRDCLRKADLKGAKKIIGDYWTVKGEVIKGDQRGRQIGFPTANISMEGWIEPLFGVYAVKVSIDGLIYKGVANLGIRPTFGQSSPLLEVHLFDYSGDLYGNDIVISFIDFIREEKKFDGIEALKKQIEIDSTKAIELIIEN